MDIQHDGRQQKFFVIEKGREYSLEYNEVDPHLWEFHCSFTPSEEANPKEKSIRDGLIEYAIYYMKRNGIQILESGCCPQVKDFLESKREMEFMIKK